LTASGCGGESAARKLALVQKRQECLINAEHGAEAAIIRKQVAAGKISKAKIVGVFPRNMAKSKYLAADGNLLPYNQIHGIAVDYFENLRIQLESTRKWHAILHAASQKAFERVKARCAALS
jgi:hypothetical protein